MEKYKNRLCPIDDLNHFLHILRNIEDECSSDSYVTDKIANKHALGGNKLRYDENFYLALEDDYCFGTFTNYEIPRELQKRIVCVIEQYVDELDITRWNR